MRGFATGILLMGASVVAMTTRPPVASAQAADDAVSLSKRASSEYKDGKFAEAAADYDRAYHLKADPTLLFNLGRCYEALATRESLEKAVAAYESYLNEANAPADAEALRRRIDSLREQIEILTKKDEPPHPAPAVAPPAPAVIEHTPRLPPLLVLTSGAVVIAVGGALAGAAAKKHGDAIDEPEGRAAADLQSSAKGLATGANVCFGIGGAVALGGLVWTVVDAAIGHPKPVLDLSVHPLVGAGTLGFEGSF